MAWANSGLYASTLAACITTTTNEPDWNLAASNRFALTNTSDATLYNAALASAVWGSHSANEVHDSSAWPAGGVLMSTCNAGGSMAPTLTVSGPTPVLMVWTASGGGISVPGTTLTGAMGGYFYSTVTTLYLIMGVYFGGTAYSTVAGTFAVTWTSNIIATVNCATAA
jgi:hypothetical protein